jgi:hypothetical protein
MAGRSAYSLLLACFACLSLLHAQQRRRNSLNQVYLSTHNTLNVPDGVVLAGWK